MSSGQAKPVSLDGGICPRHMDWPRSLVGHLICLTDGQQQLGCIPTYHTASEALTDKGLCCALLLLDMSHGGRSPAAEADIQAARLRAFAMRTSAMQMPLRALRQSQLHVPAVRGCREHLLSVSCPAAGAQAAPKADVSSLFQFSVLLQRHRGSSWSAKSASQHLMCHYRGCLQGWQRAGGGRRAACRLPRGCS